MRILMWTGIGFAVGCGISVYLLPGGWILIAAAAAFLLAALAGACAVRWKRCGAIMIALLGVGAGLLRYGHYQHFKVEPAREMDQTVVEVTLTATDFSYETSYGHAVDAVAEIGGMTQKIRVYFDEDPSLGPGDSLDGAFRFRFAAPKEGEKTSFLQTNGVFLTAHPKGETAVTKASEHSWRYAPAILARTIKDHLLSSFPGDVYPFAEAVLLGDTTDISYEEDTALKISGIRHIVAVSGLHVSILYSALALITGKRRFLTVLVGIPVLVLFAGVAGFTPSVTRACVMTGLMMLAQLLRKEYDGPTALSAACLLMLFIDPVAIASVSLQLSAGCVAGIFLFRERIQGWIDKKIRNVEKRDRSRVKSWFSSSIAMTLSAMSLTTPLSACYFGTVSIVGVLTNLLTLWIMNGIFIGIIVIAFLAAFWLPGAVFLGKILAWPIRFVLLVAKILSKLPLSAVYTASPLIIVWLIGCYILLPLFINGKRKRPGGYICAVALSLCVAVGGSWMMPMLYNCCVTVLDVGQGQSIILQSEGKTVLVDCGGSYGEDAADITAQTLLSMGIGRLDAVILTHEDSDHINGLPYLLTRIDADVIMLPATAAGYKIPKGDMTVIWVDRETKLSFGDAEITVYPPVFSQSNNENSLCILFDTEKCDILITGDRSQQGEAWLLEQYTIPDVDLLIAGHHGAKDSTGDALLDAVRPETVIISVGLGNIYGHPAPEVLERLEDRGCTVLRTDMEGTIVYRR